MLSRSNHIITIVLALAVAGLALASCKVTQDYRKPTFPMPSAYRVPDSIKKLEDSVVVSWRDFFRDTVLERMIDSAITENLDMKDALKDIQIADQYFRKSKAQAGPEADLNLAGVNKQFRSDNYYSTPSSGWYDKMGGTPPKNMYVYQSQFINSFDMGWEIDIWGKISRMKEAARASYLQ